MTSLVLDATIGGASANSWVDLDEAEATIAVVPNADAWTSIASGDVGEQTKIQRLIFATSLLDVLAWRGRKLGNAEGQALAWPRVGVRDPDAGVFDSPDLVSLEFYGDAFGFCFVGPDVIPKRVKRAQVMLALELLRSGTADVWGVDDTRLVASERIGPIETTYVDPTRRVTGLRRYPSVWREIFPLLRQSNGLSVERA